MADIINGKPIYDKPVDNSIPENPEEPVTYITNLPGEMAKFKEDSQLRMPDITSPNNDKFMFIPETPQGEVNFRKEWPDVDVLPMPWNQSGDPNFKIPNQPSEEDLDLFEKEEKFKTVLMERMGIDPDAVQKKAEKDYLDRYPLEQRTHRAYAAAAEFGRRAKLEVLKQIDPYMKRFRDEITRKRNMQDFQQRADYQDDLIRKRQKEQKETGKAESILKNLESEAYKQAVRETQFKFKDAIGFEVDENGKMKIAAKDTDALSFFNQRLDQLKKERIAAAVKRGALPQNYAPQEMPPEEATRLRVNAITDYLNQHGKKYDQQTIYNELKKQYRDEEIGAAWRAFNGR